MYSWVVFLHMVSVFGFLTTHGASVMASLRLRKERNLERVRALLDLSSYTFNTMYSFFGLLMLSGIVAGFMKHWWGKGWIWAALGLLVAMTAAMYALASPYYSRLRKTAGLPYFQGMRGRPAEPSGSQEDLARLLASSRPLLIAGIGVVGLVVILWLMMFKPF